jgi:hypothetical protein
MTGQSFRGAVGEKLETRAGAAGDETTVVSALTGWLEMATVRGCAIGTGARPSGRFNAEVADGSRCEADTPGAGDAESG